MAEIIDADFRVIKGRRSVRSSEVTAGTAPTQRKPRRFAVAALVLATLAASGFCLGVASGDHSVLALAGYTLGAPIIFIVLTVWAWKDVHKDDRFYDDLRARAQSNRSPQRHRRQGLAVRRGDAGADRHQH